MLIGAACKIHNDRNMLYFELDQNSLQNPRRQGHVILWAWSLQNPQRQEHVILWAWSEQPTKSTTTGTCYTLSLITTACNIHSDKKRLYFDFDQDSLQNPQRHEHVKLWAWSEQPAKSTTTGTCYTLTLITTACKIHNDMGMVNVELDRLACKHHNKGKVRPGR